MGAGVSKSRPLAVMLSTKLPRHLAAEILALSGKLIPFWAGGDGISVNSEMLDNPRTRAIWWIARYDVNAALYIAVDFGDARVVKHVLEQPAVQLAASCGDLDPAGTSVTHASELGYEALVEMLLEAGKTMLGRHAPWPPCWQALYVASKAGHATIVKLLLAAGVDEHSRGTALHAAVESRSVDVVQVLLKAGVGDIARGKALEAAANGGFTDIVQLLAATAD